jgi:hypothetical protein
MIHYVTSIEHVDAMMPTDEGRDEDIPLVEEARELFWGIPAIYNPNPFPKRNQLGRGFSLPKQPAVYNEGVWNQPIEIITTHCGGKPR